MDHLFTCLEQNQHSLDLISDFKHLVNKPSTVD